MKRIVAALILSMISSLMYSQTFIRTIEGKNYWSEKHLDDIISDDEIPVNNERNILRIQKSDIILMEDMETGLKILQPDKIKKVEPSAFDNNLETFLAKGKRVYIPLASSTTQQRWGARKLRELFDKNKYWQIVGCEEEADFILEYVFVEEGRDKAFLLISDRMGNNILYTSLIYAADWVPADAGKESAEKLFKWFFLRKVQEGKVSKDAKFIKKTSAKTFNCSYYIKIKLV